MTVEWWQNHWMEVCTVAGLVIGTMGLVSIPLAILLHRKARPQRCPRYCIKMNRLFVGFKDIVPDVSVHYSGHGEPLENLTVSEILFWNAGNIEIRKADVLKGHLVTIEANEGIKILGQSIIAQNEPLNGITLNPNREKTRITIDFEYLEPRNGVLIQIAHSGTGCNDDLTFTGKVIGAEIKPAPTPFSRSRFYGRMQIMSVVATVLIFAWVLISFWLGNIERGWGGLGILGAVSLAIQIVSFYLYWKIQRKVHPDFNFRWQ